VQRQGQLRHRRRLRPARAAEAECATRGCNCGAGRAIIGCTSTEEVDMETIRHRIGVNAPIDDVYDAVATRDGTTRWWTKTVEGDDGVGGKLGFFFGGPDRAALMEIVQLDAPSRVVWRCVEGPAEWVGATLTFELRPGEGETIVLFTHDGWEQPVEFMH